MVATDLPSICRWKATFHPKSGALFTTTRPGGGLACTTVLIDIAHTKARIRSALLPKLRLDLMADITHKSRFYQSTMLSKIRKYSENLASKDGFRERRMVRVLLVATVRAFMVSLLLALARIALTHTAMENDSSSSR
jgi:hypothetical protein